MKKGIISIVALIFLVTGCGQKTLEEPIVSKEEAAKEEKVETFKVIDTTDLEQYVVETKEFDKTSAKNKYEQVLDYTLPDVKVNQVIENADQTVSIDFHPDYLEGQHLTSSAQLSVFIDKITYAMYENFPEIKGYYFVSEEQPAYISEFGEFTEMLPNDLTDYSFYLPINENREE